MKREPESCVGLHWVFDMDVYLTLNCRFFLSLLYNFFVENVGVRTYVLCEYVCIIEKCVLGGWVRLPLNRRILMYKYI